MLSTQSIGTLFAVPTFLVLCATVMLTALLLLVAVVARVVLRRVEEDKLPVALLGLAHVISALGGLLPWGRPTPPPPLPQQPSGETESTKPTMVLVQGDNAEGAVARRADR
ncbi:hypothetical protein ABZX77_27770 [Streptomyces sp. NPDC004237]|uniref:hypothetical protein n=1 Tax=Streptomyces sp. NPDC004237 TaxID=3154455 RepID=UPI0033B4D23A